MNFKTAAYASAAGFLLSFLVALFAGIPLFDVLVRAMIWGVVVGGLAMGAEVLLRSQLPDLFGPSEEPQVEEVKGESVNIVLEDDPSRPFVEEMQETTEEETQTQGPSPAGPAPEARPSEPAPSASPASGEEPMAEIGSFLNAFRPQEAEGEETPEASASPDIAEYVPQEGGGEPPSSTSYAPSRGADLDGMEQDPAVLAKAIKTVMNKT